MRHPASMSWLIGSLETWMTFLVRTFQANLCDWSMSCGIAFKRMSVDLTVDKATLVLVMTWCCQAASHSWANVDPGLFCHMTSSAKIISSHICKVLYIVNWPQLIKSEEQYGSLDSPKMKFILCSISILILWASFPRFHHRVMAQ